MTKEQIMTEVLRGKNTQFTIAEFDEVVIELMHDGVYDREDAMLVAIHAAMLKANLLKRKGVI